MHRTLSTGTLIIFALTTPALSGVTTTFGFEPEMTGNTGLSQTFEQDGHEIMVSVEAPIAQIVDSDRAPESWGSRQLLLGGGSQSSPLTITFVGGVSDLAIEFGDFGGDTDNLRFDLYSGANGTGSLLSSTNDIYDADLSTGDIGRFSASSGTDSPTYGSLVIVTTGSAGRPSLYFDNIEITVPAPGSVLALVLGCAATARRRR
jgi:hypothetical protein